LIFGFEQSKQLARKTSNYNYSRVYIRWLFLIKEFQILCLFPNPDFQGAANHAKGALYELRTANRHTRMDLA